MLLSVLNLRERFVSHHVPAGNHISAIRPSQTLPSPALIDTWVVEQRRKVSPPFSFTRLPPGGFFGFSFGTSSLVWSGHPDATRPLDRSTATVGRNSWHLDLAPSHDHQ